MSPLPVTLNLHCYECGREVEVDYQPLSVPEARRFRAVEGHFDCPHCGLANEIDLTGPLIGARKKLMDFVSNLHDQPSAGAP